MGLGVRAGLSGLQVSGLSGPAVWLSGLSGLRVWDKVCEVSDLSGFPLSGSAVRLACGAVRFTWPVSLPGPSGKGGAEAAFGGGGGGGR